LVSIRLICQIFVSSSVGSFAPYQVRYPACKVCGSSIVKENHVNMDLGGNFKGEWLCDNGHRNEYDENRKGDKSEHYSYEKSWYLLALLLLMDLQRWSDCQVLLTI